MATLAAFSDRQGKRQVPLASANEIATVMRGVALDPANGRVQSVRLDHTEVLPASIKGAWLLPVRAANGQAGEQI